MKVGLLLSNFAGVTAPGRSAAARVATTSQLCESAGFRQLFLCDHQWRDVPPTGDGSTDRPTLDPFTTLGVMAGATSVAFLGLLVAGAHFRPPAMLVKDVTTLDVLSGGRACFGIGAGWYEEECRGLGIPFPPLRERYELLEDTVRLARAMWAPGADVYSAAPALKGRHVEAHRALCSPAPVQTPHPPIIIGGNGIRRTLPLVARYADACNLMVEGDQDEPLPVAALQQRIDALAGYCEQEGRGVDDVELTATMSMDVDEHAHEGTVGVAQALDRLAVLASLGFDTVVVCDSPSAERSLFTCPGWLDVWAEIIPAVSTWTP